MRPRRQGFWRASRPSRSANLAAKALSLLPPHPRLPRAALRRVAAAPAALRLVPYTPAESHFLVPDRRTGHREDSSLSNIRQALPEDRFDVTYTTLATTLFVPARHVPSTPC